MKRNALICKSLKPNDPFSKSQCKRSDGEGLFFWVMPNGKRYWRFKYTFLKKPKEYAIGVYPEVTLKEARHEKYKSRKLLAQGKDPLEERKREKIDFECNAQNTFQGVALKWYENRKDQWKPRSSNNNLITAALWQLFQITSTR